MKYKAIIFDLDQTLIDSSALETLRSNRKWAEVLKSFHLITINSALKSIVLDLASKGLKIGIITNSPRMYAEAILNFSCIPYDALICYHDVTKRKPHPEAFLKMLSMLKVACHECISVGDQDNDILASQRADITAIGVNWHSPTYTISIPHQIIISNPEQLLTHINP